ncbi:MAG: OmpA family protein [Deltaproteobacteria bacterium]|nr:OmpA family protein [Deltaproteobacteria bacterium]
MRHVKGLLAILFIVVLIGLTGCSHPSSRVILLDANKTENAIIVKTTEGELVLDKPNTYTELRDSGAKPSAAREIEPQELQNRYGNLINSLPKLPKHFLLYFDPDASTPTAESKKLFPDIEKAIKERTPCDVNVIGHTDRVGPKSYNIELSLSRARVVHRWLLGQELDIVNITIESYGEEDPLIITPDGVAEPRNRRVEILIR